MGVGEVSFAADEAVDLAAGLEAAMARAGHPGRVERLARLSAGATQEIWSFDLVDDGDVHPLILRRAPAARKLSAFAMPLDREARLVERVAAGGVPVPSVALILRPEDGLREGYVMARLAGETLPPRIIRKPDFAAARDAFAGQAGDILARLHAVPLEGLDLTGGDAGELVARLGHLYDETGRRRPVFDMALAWMAGHLPPPVVPALVHGDFRNGNLMFAPDGVVAVLDWELAHVGDPVEDIGWLTVNSWRFGVRDRPVGGLADLAPFLSAYEAASGRRVEPERLRFWQVYGTMRWGVMCAAMVGDVESGADHTPERAMIARRASETEIDLLDLLLPGGAFHA